MSDQHAIAELQARLARRERELEAARRVSEAVRQRASLEEIIKAAVSVAVEVVGGRAGSVMLADPERARLVFHVSVGDNPVTPGTAISSSAGIAGQVFHSGEPKVVRNAQQGGHFGGIDELTGFKTVNMFALPLKGSDGRPFGVMEVLNKSDGGPAEEDLAVLSIIATLTAFSIEQARLFEEAKLAEMVHRLSEIGHDIKNMLMPISVGVDILDKEVKQSLNALNASPESQELREQIHEAVTMVKRASRRVQDRVRQITDYVKGRQSPPRLEPCLVPELIEELVSTLRPVAAERGIRLDAADVAHLPRIEADKSRLYTALYNLVDNAIPETPSGGSITIQGEVDPNGREIVLRVRDTGRGMPPEVRSTLFSMKMRSHKRGGTGLGTKVVHDIVTAHGGRITVDSEIGRGTTFSLWLPIKQQGPKAGG